MVSPMAFVLPASPLAPLTPQRSSTLARTPTRHTPICATSSAPNPSRRNLLRLALLAPAAALAASVVATGRVGGVAAANALSLRDLEAHRTAGVIKTGRTKAGELAIVAANWKESKDEECEIVLRFIPIWMEPARVAAERLAGVLKGNEKADVAKLQSEAQAMLGHLYELKAEAKAQNRDGIVRELKEYVETADTILEVLKGAGIA